AMGVLERGRIFGVHRVKPRIAGLPSEAGVIGDEDRDGHPRAIQLPRSGKDPLVTALRKYYPALQLRRFSADSFNECHRLAAPPNFAANALATAGCTRPLRLPWCCATSRTTLELM